MIFFKVASAAKVETGKPSDLGWICYYQEIAATFGDTISLNNEHRTLIEDFRSL